MRAHKHNRTMPYNTWLSPGTAIPHGGRAAEALQAAPACFLCSPVAWIMETGVTSNELDF
jgi:hypothetical protein